MKIHIGVLMLLIFFYFSAWIFSDEMRDKYDYHYPIVAGVIVWVMFEILFWIIYLFFNY